MMRKLTAWAERGVGWWVVEVPESEGLLTQARILGQIPAMVKDAAALITGEPEDSFEVEVTPVIAAGIRAHVDAARRLFDEAKRAQHSAAEEARRAARELAAFGLTVRDVGQFPASRTNAPTSWLVHSRNNGQAAGACAR